MTKRGLNGSRIALGLSLLALTTGLGTLAYTGLMPVAAHAQIFGDDDKDDPTQPPTDSTVWDAKRLLKLDRNVRKLERSVARVENSKSPPILIEPDPEVVALQATVDTLSRKQDDQGAALTAARGTIEEQQHQIQVLMAQNAALMARVDTLTKRADLSDAHLKDIDGQLAGPPPPPPSTGSAQGDFEQAYNLMTSGKIDDATRAFDAFTQTWPEASQLPEAWFRLGQLRSQKGDTPGAVAAYATSLKGWPKIAWAPEATVKLAAALNDANRPSDACAAIDQFDKVYGKMASIENKAMAKSIRVKDKCP